jgi:hypothetical protein
MKRLIAALATAALAAQACRLISPWLLRRQRREPTALNSIYQAVEVGVAEQAPPSGALGSQEPIVVK